MFLDARRQKLVERLFEEALEQPADLRTAWLTRACAGDDLVDRETTALLAAHDHAGLFLEVPAFAMRGTGIGREPQPGERLGHYEILERLGEGGMGAVYRAIDHRLGRNVAIKFLSASLANDPEWLLRFDEEARLAGSLNHPNVLAVHDIGTGSSGPYLVSEVLEGETLRERLARRAVGVRAAVEIALGMARGLAAAHQQAIAHRDLKPENVFLTRDGQVKILDFGIAQRLPPADQSTADGARLLSRGARAGTIEYLSPEQARGEPADSRADLFAFGVVLYEMLAGVRPFSRASADQTRHAIVSDEPAAFRAALGVPVELERLVWSCLAKEPTRRFQSAADLAVALEAVTAGRALRSWRLRGGWWGTAWRGIAWSVPAALAALAAMAVFSTQSRAVATVAQTMRPPSATTFASVPVVSPDGSSIAFVAEGVDGRFIWVRPLATLTARRVDGTAGALQPFWSPDGGSLGFFADGKLKKVSLSQGAGVELAEAPAPRGGTWTAGETIVYAPDVSSELRAVRASGGAPWSVTVLDRHHGENSHRWPQALPDGSHVLFLSRNETVDRSGVFVADLAAADGSSTSLAPGTSNAVLARAVSGSTWLLFVRSGVLLARAFDVQRRVLTGGDEAVARGVGEASPELPAAVSASQSGVLAYSSWAGPRQQLEYEDLRGRVVRVLGDPGIYMNPRISPDGESLAFARLDAQTGQVDVSVLHVASNRTRRLTSEPSFSGIPAWSPDGRRIAYTADRLNPSSLDLYMRLADGTGQETCLVCQPGIQTNAEWTPDGRFILYDSVSSGHSQIWAVPASGDGAPMVVLPTVSSLGPRVSPDGHWLAYVSDESSRREVYVRELHSDGLAPIVGPARTVSVAGGNEPRWRRDGQALYYVGPDRHLVSVSVGAHGQFLSDVSTRLAAWFDPVPGGPRPFAFAHYDVAAGEGELIVPRQMSTTPTPATIVSGWVPPSMPAATGWIARTVAGFAWLSAK